jgi:tetratricopeptide (TPR) repeat protein
MHGEGCGAWFRRALKLDPGFALASWRLAVWASWNGRPRYEVRALLADAERHRDRLPDKEGALVGAWADHLDGKDEEALAQLDEVGRRWPEDKQSFYEAGDILRHRDEPARAVPYFERAVALEPDFAWALGGLAQSLGALGRRDELRALAERWGAAGTPGAWHALVLARGWLGDLEGAVEAARHADRAGGGLPAREDLLGALVFAGRYAEAEPEVAGLLDPASPVRRIGYYGLAALDAYRGRPRAGLARLDALARELPEVQRDALYHALRADYLLGLDDLTGVRAEVDATRRLDPALAAEHAVSLAWLGDVRGAEALARELPPALPLARTAAAIARLRGGDRAGGLEALGRAASDMPVVVWRIAPLFAYGEALAREGRDAEAIDVLRRAEALYVPLAMWRSWALPRAEVLVARSLARLGRAREARAGLDRLLAEARGAEPDCAWVVEARALRSRLAAR